MESKKVNLFVLASWVAAAIFACVWMLGDTLGDLNLAAASAFCFVLGFIFKELTD